MTNWDNEIDEVARAMTEGEPHGSLKARVLARLEDQPRPTWRSPWILAPIATVAIAVVVAFVMRGPDEVRLKPETTAQVRLKPDATPQVRLKPDITAVAPEPTEPVVVSALRRTSTVRSTTVAAETRTADIDSLAPPPIEIEPIDVDDMENMESLQVPALSVSLLEVPAIGE
jgi:hypothetical protein